MDTSFRDLDLLLGSERYYTISVEHVATFRRISQALDSAPLPIRFQPQVFLHSAPC